MMYRGTEHKEELREEMRGGKGVVKLTELAGEIPDHLRLFSLITLPEGASIGYHVHEQETELFYFLQGAGRVNDNGAFFDVLPGDTLRTPGGHGHSVENIGRGDLRILACIVRD